MSPICSLEGRKRRWSICPVVGSAFEAFLFFPGFFLLLCSSVLRSSYSLLIIGVFVQRFLCAFKLFCFNSASFADSIFPKTSSWCSYCCLFPLLLTMYRLSFARLTVASTVCELASVLSKAAIDNTRNRFPYT